MKRPKTAVVASIVAACVLMLAGCSDSEPTNDDRVASRLPLTALLERMLPPREELMGVPDFSVYEESHSVHTNPNFEIGDAQATIAKLQDGGWVLGIGQDYHNTAGFTGGSIWVVSLTLDSFSDSDTASRALAVMHDATLNHIAYTEGMYGITEELPVRDLGGEARGAKTTVYVDGMPITVAIIRFAQGNTVGSVWVERRDDVAEVEIAESIGKVFFERIKAAKAGRFDDEPADLQPVDVLVLSRRAMEGQATFHATGLRRVLLLGEEDEVSLDFDVGPAEAASGTVDLVGAAPLAVYVKAGVAYASRRAGLWDCLTEETGMNPALTGIVRPRFDLILQRAGESTEIAFSRDDDPDLYHIRSTINARPFLNAVPEVLGSGSYLRNVYPGIGAGTVVVDLTISKEDFTVTALDYEMRVSTDGEQVVIRSEFTFTDYGKAVVFPEGRDLPLCIAHDDPDCKGSHLNGCNGTDPELMSPAIPPSACDGTVERVCIVPVGRVTGDLLFPVVDRVRELVPDAPIAIAPAVTARGLDISREQISDLALLGSVQGAYPGLIEDPKVIVIAVTPIDLYSANEPGTRFVFGLRRGPSAAEYRLGVLSYWRLDNSHLGEAPDDDLLEERLTKLVLKYVLNMYSNLPETSDPTDVMYSRLFSVSAVDAVELPAR